LLEKNYQSPVDTEFTLNLVNPSNQNPDIEVTLLQCRPQSHLEESKVELPQNLHKKDIIFATKRVAPEGRVNKIRYVLFVTPEGYFGLPTTASRSALGRLVGRVNAKLEGETFICIGPGRWGTTNPDLGVHIGYADIYHTRALVELTGKGIGAAPEASFGTHFFQDLVESNIYPLAIYLDDDDAVFQRNFFYKTPNQLTSFLPDVDDLADCLRLIEVDSFRPGYHLELVMDGETGRSVAYLEKDS